MKNFTKGDTVKVMSKVILTQRMHKYFVVDTLVSTQGDVSYYLGYFCPWSESDGYFAKKAYSHKVNLTKKVLIEKRYRYKESKLLRERNI